MKKISDGRNRYCMFFKRRLVLSSTLRCIQNRHAVLLQNDQELKLCQLKLFSILYICCAYRVCVPLCMGRVA